MLKRLALILGLIPAALGAQTDPSARAAAIAGNFMGKANHSLKSQLIPERIIPVGKAETPAAFVVTYQPAGFVIVSGRQTESPILGYSTESTFPDEPGHPLLTWLLPQYELASTGHQKGLKGNTHATDRMVKPLISAQWGQGNPWNRFCPADPTGNRALAGCVAVAMSQIMEKWRWPLQGTGQVAYTQDNHPEYGTITANFDTTHYRWDLTHPVYATDAAALVLFQTGAATFMNYDPQLSSTSVDRFALQALMDNFSYQPGMIFREMNGSDPAEWTRMLHQELDNSRPVLYAGTTPDGKSSHAFNIDGYRNGQYFHFNWGWNGAGDGWYTLVDMGGGSANFSTQQGAIFGIQPSTMPLHDRPSSLDILSGDGFTQLFWKQPVIADFSHFSVYRDGEVIGTTHNTHYRDTTPLNGREYTYAVTAHYQGETPGESAETPEVTVIPWSRVIPGYTQTFEFGHEGWQHQDSTSGFRITDASAAGFGGHPGKVAAIRSEGHETGEQVADYLSSPVIYPGNQISMAVSFDYLFKQNPGVDKLQLLWRDFTTGQWVLLANLDSTGGYSSWKTLHFYLPRSGDDNPIQIAFSYDDNFGQGYGAAIDNVNFYLVPQPTEPELATDLKDACREQTVTFSDQSKGPVKTWEWDFGEGATPRYATTKGPHEVTYSIPGQKTVKLSLNHLDHLVMPDLVSIREKPVAAIEYSRKFQTIYFTSKATAAEELLWIFGDGTTSTETDPVHTYYSKELFEVRQIASNGTCAPDTLTVKIDMRNGTGIEETEAGEKLTVYPNPTTGKLNLLWNTTPSNDLNIKIFTVTGQTLLNRNFPPQEELSVDLSDFPDGILILRVTSGKLVRNQQIVKNAH